MGAQKFESQDSTSNEEITVRELYGRLIDSWNQRNAVDYAALFDQHANLVGFDGSQVDGRAEIEAHIGAIFADHQTAAYVCKIRGVRFLTSGVAILRAVVGMVPPGQSDLNPAANAIQTLVAAQDDGQWRITLFQNTPAQFHGRPETAQALTDELRQLL